MSPDLEKPAESSEKKLPPIIPDDGSYAFTRKENVFWKAMEGLGTGWGMAVAIGTFIEFFVDLAKPKGTRGRFSHLIASDSNWRQVLDGAGMATGAAIMAVKAKQHNDTVDGYAKAHDTGSETGAKSYTETIEAQRSEKDSAQQPIR